ncbi:MAG: hypothetical protein AAGB24_14635 [Bacteroidota bacterium]
MKNFKKQIIKVDLQRIENQKRAFGILANNVNQFKLDLNAKMDATFSLADVVDFIEDPSTLENYFKEVEKSAIRKRADAQGVTLRELEQLENIELTKVQLDFIARAKKLKQSLLFQSMGSKEWLVDGEIVLTEEVEQVLTEACTTYTNNELENSRLAVLKVFKKHLELDRYDKNTMLRILGNNDPESFIGFKSR